jgi:flagellar basal-body rod protein FlgF
VSTGIWIAASGAVSQLTSLDVTANNVANASTAGYKSEHATFSERLLSVAQAGRAQPQMRYNSVREVASDFEPGPIRVTERGLDVAIRGNGFIAVQGPTGERYTRAGDLQTDATGALRTSDGSLVLDASRKPIRLPLTGGDMRIGASGEVLVGGESVAQLRLVQFDAPHGLTKVGHSVYQANAASGAPKAGGVELETGALEMSNANPVKGMTDMVTITRSFDALEHVIDTFKTVEQRAATSLMGRR